MGGQGSLFICGWLLADRCRAEIHRNSRQEANRSDVGLQKSSTVFVCVCLLHVKLDNSLHINRCKHKQCHLGLISTPVTSLAHYDSKACGRIKETEMEMQLSAYSPWRQKILTFFMNLKNCNAQPYNSLFNGFCIKHVMQELWPRS